MLFAVLMAAQAHFAREACGIAVAGVTTLASLVLGLLM